MRPAGGPGVQPNILQRAGSPRWKDLPGPNVSSANVGTPCPCDKWCGESGCVISFTESNHFGAAALRADFRSLVRAACSDLSLVLGEGGGAE